MRETFGKLAFLAGCWAFAGSFGLAAQGLPPAPDQYVFDEPRILSARAERALEALLIEHEQATGEQFVVAIFKSLHGEDLNDFTNRVFKAWKIGERNKDNGVLLAVFNEEHHARIEVGYGLEGQLTDAASSHILQDILVPQMKAGNADAAITLSAYQVLRVLGSPLLQNGRAEAILRSSGASLRRTGPSSGHPLQNAWVVWIVLGFSLLLIVFNLLSSAEAHFTGAGWYRPRPWRRQWGTPDGLPPSGTLRRPGGFFGGFPGGGFPGGGGGGGGFLGGGGSSGGGGASAGW